MKKGFFAKVFEVFRKCPDGIGSVGQRIGFKFAMRLALDCKQHQIFYNPTIFGHQLNKNIPEIGIELMGESVYLVSFQPDDIAWRIEFTVDMKI
jgi:hypothetical protein